MSSRTAATLHVTNGDSVIYLFKKAGILGTHVPWRDALHEGPLNAELQLEAHSRMRGEYLANRGLGNPIKILHDFSSRDSTLARAADFEEVVLWFEHDLYDQLQILQILVELDNLQLEPGRVSIVQSDSYLGSMIADEIVALHPKRRTVTAQTFSHARTAWNAVGSASPAALLALTERDIPSLPFLRSAARRLCEEYPWASDGLSRTQRQALQAVAQGPARLEELFNRSQSREETVFLGDRMFYAVLDDLRTDAAPLIEEDGATLALTALGRRLLSGDGDWLDVASCERFVGGVSIKGSSSPRWNDDRQCFA